MSADVLLTVVVPALNEEAGIRDTLQEVCRAFDAAHISGNVLAVDDGGTDATLRIMQEEAAQDPRITVIHHETPQGLGQDYWEAAHLATGTYFALIPGDAEISPRSIETLFRSVGMADIISAHAINPVIRGWKRRVISSAYVRLINGLFGYSLRYYNGPCIVRTSLITKLAKPSTSFAYMTEIIVQLLDQGASIHEVEMTLRQRLAGHSKAFKWKNIRGVVQTIFRMHRRLRVRP